MQLLVEVRDPLLVDRPVEEAAQLQHAPAQEQGAGKPVVIDVLQKDQDHSVPPLLHHPVKSVVGLESGRHEQKTIRGTRIMLG